MADEDFDDNYEDEEGEIDTGVQLGFMSETKNSMFADTNWEKWDGGKVGGKPSWLNPFTLPAPADLSCKFCNSQMTFLLQIYCPLDDVDDAFHRSLYIFICKKKNCVDSGSVKCIRNQLGRKNEIYPYDPKSTEVAIKEGTRNLYPKLCALCGCRAPSTCSKCRSVSYCSREHQARDWKDHKQCCGALLKSKEVDQSTDSAALAAMSTNNLTFAEFNLSISAEILEDLEKVDALNKSVLEASIWENATAVEEDDCSDDEDEKDDAALTQTDYNSALGNEASDLMYTKFMERVRRGGSNQVLRYIRWDDIEGPLTLSSSDTSTGPRGTAGTAKGGDQSAECCLNCGAERRFEFQVMPQLLHFLRVDRRTQIASSEREREKDDSLPPAEEESRMDSTSADQNKEKEQEGELCLLKNKAEEDIDWGTIDVYTCTASCSGSLQGQSAYLEEATYVQRPLSFVRSASKPMQPVQV